MNAIEVRGLSRKFGDQYAVKDLSFEVEKGIIYGLLGPNGAGKTTTIRILATVLSPNSGTAVLNGSDVKENPQNVRMSVGVLTTHIGLYERFTARENIEYFARLYGMEDKKIKSRVDSLLDQLEAGYLQHKKAGELSTGMRQKVAIARSVVHDPPIIIFDEPTLGLDVLASQVVTEFMIEARKKGQTVVLSTHDMHMAQKMCDSVAVIHEGELVASGKPMGIIEGTGTNDLEEAFVDLVSGDGGGPA